MRPSGLVALAALLFVTACSDHGPCPPGDDCRWVIDAPRLGLWVAADPEVAAVLRLGPPGGPVLYAYAVWERCGAEVCPWVPPASQRRLARQEGGTWVVSLTRSSFARDPAAERTLPVSERTRVRLGTYLVRGAPVAPTTSDLDTCIRDLDATLTAAVTGDASGVHDVEIELVCRIWLHPAQGRPAMSWHPTLHEVARAHACDMAARDYFSHTSPEGIGPNRRALDAGYLLPDWYDGEADGNNIESLALRGPTSSPMVTVEQWLESPLHRRHVLAETAFKAEQGDTATGYCVARDDDLDRHYWVFVSALTAP